MMDWIKRPLLGPPEVMAPILAFIIAVVIFPFISFWTWITGPEIPPVKPIPKIERKRLKHKVVKKYNKFVRHTTKEVMKEIFGEKIKRMD